MAQSPAHRLGQIVGDQLELALREPLQAIAKEFGLYLDYKHPRRARTGRRKVVWKDLYGNTHDLDYVLEEGGSEGKLGEPLAFVETAWRRYTKHSRNKVQEIQGAIVPLAETYARRQPFLGAVLAGDFTDGSLRQLRSHRFHLAYCPYETIVQAFATEGVDISSEESTAEEDLQSRVDAFDRLTQSQQAQIAAAIRQLHESQFTGFLGALRRSLERGVSEIFVSTLSGASRRFQTIRDAMLFVSGYDEGTPQTDFVRYELNVRHTNGDEVRATFGDRRRVIEFLESLDSSP